MVRIIPNRLKSYSGKTGENSASHSRAQSPMRTSPIDHQELILRTTVHRARNLTAKDKDGSSDPFLVVHLGDARQATPSISKTLNPDWNVTFDLPINGSQSMLLEAVCWDKDRFKNDYMGEFDLPVEEIFMNGDLLQKPRWYPLKSMSRSKRKDTSVSGDVQMSFELRDPQNSSSSPTETITKLLKLCDEAVEDAVAEDDLTRLETLEIASNGLNEDSDEKERELTDEPQDPSKNGLDNEESRRRRLRVRALRRRAKSRAYEFTNGSDVLGIAFLEIVKITGLPPERNVTRTSFDMDPFVVASLGRKTYRTRVVRHDLNPIFEEKMVYQVMRHEQNYSISFSVIDRDKLSGNDFVGTASLPLANLMAAAPSADAQTGLYRLPEPPDTSLGLPQSGNSRSRFRLPVSRSSSSSNLSKVNSRPGLSSRNSQASLNNMVVTPVETYSSPSDSNHDPNGPELTPASANSAQESEDIPLTNEASKDDPLLRTYVIPLVLRKKDRWEDKSNPQLYIRAKYLPYPALRQQFWRAMLKQYDSDENARVSKLELTTMLDTLGSTLKDSTIDGFFQKYAGPGDNADPTLTYDQAVICLEERLQQTEQVKSWSERVRARMPAKVAERYEQNFGNKPSPPNDDKRETEVPTISPPSMGAAGEQGDFLEEDLVDERDEEHVVEIRECPLCHQPRLKKRSDADIITHIATCASQDWRQVNNIVMAGFVTASQAQRKWYSKVITKISYGGYRLGANSANILVQDRTTGQINEERMSVYVRIGIRLLYKGLKSREMEKKRIRKMLRNMSFKQGRKYDDPASASQIRGFINFHQLDMSEVLKPVDDFRNFNEFFYRELKPGARPCSAPDDPGIIVSPADCRSVLFNTLQDAQRIWVKGREFSVETLLGSAFPEDVNRYQKGSLGIFRLAPQDYHRFHVPVDGTLCTPKLIEGEYYTVNPMAIRSALDVYGENVRVCVPIESVAHGRVMVICIGAMMVGSTVITRAAGEQVHRAEELGYFKFGGSTILLLFEQGKMQFDDDLIDNSQGALETLLRVGMSVGHRPGQSQYLPDMRKHEDTVTHAERQEAKRRIEGSLAPDTAYQGPSGMK